MSAVAFKTLSDFQTFVKVTDRTPEEAFKLSQTLSSDLQSKAQTWLKDTYTPAYKAHHGVVCSLPLGICELPTSPGVGALEGPALVEKKEKLVATVKAMGLSGPKEAALLEKVDQLAQKGLLGKLDHKGIPLVDHLQTLATQPLMKGTASTFGPAENRHFLLAAMDNVLHPEDIAQRGSSCASKALEYMMAAQSPSDYVGVITNLAAGKDAQAPGGTITFDPTATAAENSSRNLASRFFQASISHTVVPAYRNDLWEGKNGVKDRGLDDKEFGKAMKLIGGSQWKTTTNLTGWFFDLSKAKLPLPACIKWPLEPGAGSDNHEVVVTQIKDGRVYFVDAGAGTYDPGKKIVATANGDKGPDRIAEGNNVFSMPLADFEKLVRYYSEHQG